MGEHQELLTAIEAVKEAPQEPSHWDRVEEVLDTVQRPTDVSALFRDVLKQDLSSTLVTDIGQRAVRFYEAWYGEDSAELPETLERVLEIDPQASWAFQRLTVAYTVAERWDALLAAYDKAILHADQTVLRMQLLEDAAQAAKDFAGAPDRAIDYMTQLLALDPTNTTLSASLERLLERQERFADLIGLYESRLPVLRKSEAHAARVRMASVHLTHLNDPTAALAQARKVLEGVADDAGALTVVDAVLRAQGAATEVRGEALTILKQHHFGANAIEKVVEVLEISLQFVEGDDRVATLRELVERLSSNGDESGALSHQAALLQMVPSATEREALLSLAKQTQDFEQYQNALIQAATQHADTAGADFWMEAGRVLEENLGDCARAVNCYRQVFEGEQGAHSLEAGRRVVALLESTDQQQQTLDACARLAELEGDEAVRRRLLGQVARLAEDLGDSERARLAWQACVGEDTEDVEALDALIVAAEERDDWSRVCELLSSRIKAPAAAEDRRKDLRRLAELRGERLGDVDGSIEAWREIQTQFGEDIESVNALSELLSRAEKWEELAELLQHAASREVARFTEIQGDLGDAYRLRLERPREAASRYRSALQVQPIHEVARAGLIALLEVPDCTAIAAQALADAYLESDEWQLRLSLVDHLMAAAESDEAKAALLTGAAAVHEQRGDDLAAALACLRRAFTLVPDDRIVEREIRRLAETLSAWDAVVQTYRETIASFVRPTPRVGELRFYEAEILERRVGDKEGALLACQQAAQVVPARGDFAEAVVRLAGQLDRADDLVTQMLAHAAATDGISQDLLERVESVTSTDEQWARIADAMMSQIPQSEIASEFKREFYCWVARVRRDHGGEPAAVESALLQASVAEPGHVETLSLLASVQRVEPGSALVDTLLKIADRDPDNLDPLQEACEVAQEQPDVNPPLPMLKRLFEASAALFRHQIEATGERDCQSTVIWALERLVQLHRLANNGSAALALLTEAASLPFDAEAVHGLLHEAAQLAASDGKDSLRAIQIYRDILQLDARDVVAMERLGELYSDGDRMPELLMLRRHELSQGPSDERALTLRLHIAGILGDMEAQGGRVQSLEDNLSQAVGHRPSLDALSELLRAKGQHAELAALIEVQARLLCRDGQLERSAELFVDLASLQEVELQDPASAIETYKGLHELQPHGAAASELARIYSHQQDHEAAAQWLEVRLSTVSAEERSPIALALAEAQVSAGHSDRAVGCLLQLLSQTPSDTAARTMLAELYRRGEQYEALADLLLETCNQMDAEANQLELLSEIAEIYCGPLGTPDRAAPVLVRARVLAPEDDRLGAQLAHALQAARRYDEAAAVLQELIAGHGRKRSAERAGLHYQLACVLDCGGDAPGAVAELELATKMDLAHVPSLYMLARLCRKSGDLDGAERAFRGLLMLVRRQASQDVADVGPSEVFYALYGIASERGLGEQAEELMRSALEMSAQNDVEAARFQRVLLECGDGERALAVIESRLEVVSDSEQKAALLAAKGDVLEGPLQRVEDGLNARLEALACDSVQEKLHKEARATALACGALPRYLDRCMQLSEVQIAEGGSQGLRAGAELQLRAGQAVEEDLQDLDRAAAIYGRVEASGQCVVQAWLAMARVAGARGEVAEQRRVLARIGELDENEASADARGDALFMLAELGLDAGDDSDACVAHIESALLQVPNYPRASALLQRLLGETGLQPDALALLKQVAHRGGDEPLMLVWHQRAAAAEGADFADVHEGVRLALRMAQNDVAEILLHRADELAKAREIGGQSWIYAGLAECRAQAGDVSGAMAGLQQAIVEASDEEAHQLRTELARLASGEGGDLTVAAEAYEAMLEREPGNGELWRPLCQVYQQLADGDAYAAFVERTLPGLPSVEERCELHLAQARFLIETVSAELEAEGPLQAVLDELPGHEAATELLTGIYQRNQRVDELAALLYRQFDRVRDQQDLVGIADVALRIGALYPEDRPHEAIDIYRASLEWCSDEPRLLRAMLGRFDESSDLRDRAEAMHGLLASEEGAAAAKLASEVVDLWTELADDERILEALERGTAACPTDEGLRQRLESHYAERDMWGPLAELMMAQAAQQSEPAEAVAMYKNAASLFREREDDAEGAARALRAALELAPTDVSLLGEHCRNLAATGNRSQAIEDVSELLVGQAEPGEARVGLLRVRAELLTAEDRHAEAVADLEEGYKIEPANVRQDLLSALDTLKGQAFLAGERDAERSTVLRIVQLCDAGDEGDRGRDVLAQWCEAESEDLEALRALRRRDEMSERYEDVASACFRLIELEEDEARVEAALGLADACDRLGQPEASREGVERVFEAMPDNGLLRERLRQLYETLGAHRELAGILMTQAQDTHSETESRIAMYQRAAELLIAVDDPAAALEPLQQARELAPEDRNNELLAIDILLKLSRFEEAKTMLEEAIASHKRKRSPELAQLQLRMGRLCAAVGEVAVQLQWLQQAIDTDRKSGEVAGELVEVALSVGDTDAAMKALRNITMMEDPQPITRAMAFLKQAQIAVANGDARRAQHWARKAKSLDESLTEADSLLAELGA